MPDKKRVLFLCTRNSARSQMAEGLLRHMADNQFDVQSAGTEATRVHPLATAVMREIGIDISAHESKTLEHFLSQPFDYVVTVCDRANESCPLFSGVGERIPWSFDDPSGVTGSEHDRLKTFRRIRDEILGRLRMFVTLAGRG